MWTLPRTWSPGETVTASLMNAHVRDNLNALSSRAIIVGIGEGGGAEITTGVIEIPISLKLTGWTLIAEQLGSIVVDLWKNSYASFPPTAADTICGSEKPALSSAQASQDLDLTTWDDELDAGDVLAVSVESASDLASVTLTLRCEPR